MLLRHDVLSEIETGRIGAVYRKWDLARVKAGSKLRTAIGLVEVVSVDVVDPQELTQDDLIEGGFDSLSDLVASAGSRGSTLFRIRLRHAGRTRGSLYATRSRTRQASLRSPTVCSVSIPPASTDRGRERRWPSSRRTPVCEPKIWLHPWLGKKCRSSSTSASSRSWV